MKLKNSDRFVDTYVMFLNDESNAWKHANTYINDAIYHYSMWVGDYPYHQATALEGALTAGGGMEYPNVTVIGHVGGGSSLDDVITHEVGHNWFYGIFGFNERDHPWMDEGINSYYENRYMENKYPAAIAPAIQKVIGLKNFRHRDQNYLAYLFTATNHIDQPLDIPAPEYTPMNYFSIVYCKTPAVMGMLEHYLGTQTFDSLMHVFFEERKFTHVYPDDMRVFFESTTKKNLDWFFDDELKTTEPLDYKITGGRDTVHIGNSAFLKLTIINKHQIRAPYSISSWQNGQITNTIWTVAFAVRCRCCSRIMAPINCRLMQAKISRK